MKTILRWSVKRPALPGVARCMARATPFALPVACLLTLLFMSAGAQEHRGSIPQTAPQSLDLTVGKSLLLDSILPMERVSVGLGGFAEVTAVGPSEVMLSGKAPGETSLIIWQDDGSKLYYDVAVRPSRFLANNRIELVDHQIQEELPGQNVHLTMQDDTLFLRGQVKDVTSAERAYSIASTLGKAVNLLYVDVPPAEQQILLRVKFASVDRDFSQQLGVNLFSTGAANTMGSVGTEQFNPPSFTNPAGTSPVTSTLSDALNLFLFRPDLNLGATLKLLESRGLLEVLAEPNVLAQNGKQASFVAGGEFPYPVVQGSTGITLRKLDTAVELNEGQSFAIGGLLDNRVTDTIDKVPFLGDLPILGKFFQSKSHEKENTELIVIVTPEIVAPVPAGAAPPAVKYPDKFLPPNSNNPMTTPGAEVTGAKPPAPPPPAVPVETLIDSMKPEQPLVIEGGMTAGMGGTTSPGTSTVPMPQTPQ